MELFFIWWLSHATWLLVQDQIPCTHKGEMLLKGIPKPVMTYELRKSDLAIS